MTSIQMIWIIFKVRIGPESWKQRNHGKWGGDRWPIRKNVPILEILWHTENLLELVKFRMILMEFSHQKLNIVTWHVRILWPSLLFSPLDNENLYKMTQTDWEHSCAGNRNERKAWNRYEKKWEVEKRITTQTIPANSSTLFLIQTPGVGRSLAVCSQISMLYGSKNGLPLQQHGLACRTLYLYDFRVKFIGPYVSW